MNRLTCRLAALLVASCLATAPGHAEQPEPERPARPGERTLSLDDLDTLDALLEADRDEHRPVVDPGVVADVVGVTLVLALAMVSFVRKSERLKLVTLAVSVAYLGFFKASLVSIVDIFGAIRGNLPVFEYAVPYYLLIAFTLVSTILWGRLYCGRICAFGALTQLLDRIVPAQLRVEPPPWVDRRAIYLKYVILGTAVLYVLAGGDSLVYRFIEPFWMFTLSGTTVMWTLVAILLIATVFVRNLYCRYLCAVGAGLGLLSNLTVFLIKRWSECQTCKLCEKACEWGTIQGPRISLSECVRCDDCERLYADTTVCPHWILLERRSDAGAPAGPRA